MYVFYFVKSYELVLNIFYYGLLRFDKGKTEICSKLFSNYRRLTRKPLEKPMFTLIKKMAVFSRKVVSEIGLLTTQ
jgi:hypothetical protein